MLVVRKNAPLLLQNVVVSFALTVLLIRIFLMVSPVKIVVVGTFHLAHMLYGGLILFAALLLLLSYQNSRMLKTASWLTGIGFGFFIDEIGKYVSTSNDYYYKLAAPLIYLFFMATVFLFIVVKRRKPTLRERLYHALSDLEEVLDDDLERSELKQMKQTFQEVLKAKPSHAITELVHRLSEFLEKVPVKVQADKVSRWQVLHQHTRTHSEQLLSKWFVRQLFYVLFLLRIGWVIPSLILPLVSLYGNSRDEVRQWLVETGFITGSRELYPFALTSLFEILTAGALLYALSLIVRKRPRGIRMARRLLLFSIVFLGVFNVYFGQFSAVVSIVIDMALLLAFGWLPGFGQNVSGTPASQRQSNA